MKKNGWPAFLWVVVMLLFAVCLAFGGTGMKAQAAEREKKEDDGIFLGDLSAIEQFLGQKESLKTGFSFEELVKALMAGNGSRVGQLIVKGLYEALLGEISHGSRLAGELLALGLIGAIFANFSNVFSGSQISETGFFMTYLLVFTVLAAAFSDSMAITKDVLMSQTEFIKEIGRAHV